MLSPIPLPSTTLDPTSHTLVMGVINTTPDSFSDGGVHLDADVAVKSALQMLQDGADIVDVGGESTRPGSLPVSVDEELDRAIPVICGIIGAWPSAVISIDTRRRQVAESAVKAGATIINDVSGFRDDPTMIDLARETGAGLVVMHMLGQPKTMQQEIRYRSFPQDIYDFFKERIQTLERRGNRAGKDRDRSGNRLWQDIRSEPHSDQSSGRLQGPGKACPHGTVPKGVSGQDPQ